MRSTSPPLFIGALALFACTWPEAAQAQAASQQLPTAQPASPAGMTVVRDAASGTLRAPTPAEAQALQAGAALAPFHPALTTGADGRRQVKLGEYGMVHSVVRRDANGVLSQHCTHDPEAAIGTQTSPGARHATH